MNSKFLIVQFAALFFSTVTNASKIVFTASPQTFTPHLTRTLTLRCGLNDTTPNISNNIVGRDLTATVNNPKHVTSVVVKRGGVEIAAINEFSSATSLNATWPVVVTGRVGAPAGERGFLQLEFDHPDTVIAGNFECAIDAYSEDGHHLVYTDSMDVAAAETSINDLIKHVGSMDAMIKSLQTKTTNQDNLIKSLQNQTQHQAELIDSLQSDSFHNDTAIMAAVSKYRHIERGVINCPYVLSGESKTVSQKFSQTYDVKPDVTLAVRQFRIYDTSGDGRDKDVYVSLSSVDTSGFSVTCHTTSYYISSVDISWISFPN